jgi:cytochrome b
MPEAEQRRLVWDLPVRATHWLLVVFVTGAWLTYYAGPAWFGWHRRCGYAVLILVAFRVVWGFAGTRHARFASFLRGPRAIAGYLRGGLHGAPGHNPLGGWSVVALLALLLFEAVTGLFANDEIASAGPFYGWVAHATSNRLAALHRVSSNWLLGLIALHVCAIAWYALVRRQPLVRALWSGYKSARQVPADQAIAGSRLGLAALIVAALAAVLALLVRAAPDEGLALF